MADKIERLYNVPLRSGFINTPKYKRAKKAINTLKLFMQKHMKAETIKIGNVLNELIWKNGIKNPPHHVAVKAIKENDIVKVELQGHEYKDAVKIEKKVDKKESLKDKLAAKLGAADEKKEEKAKATEENVDEVKDALGGEKKKEETLAAPKKESPKKPTVKKETPKKTTPKKKVKKASKTKKAAKK